MFGTGTLRFAVITTVLSLLTYGTVFGLLYRDKLVVALKKGFHASKDDSDSDEGKKNNGALAQTTMQVSMVSLEESV
jgi:hypothetical protein